MILSLFVFSSLCGVLLLVLYTCRLHSKHDHLPGPPRQDFLLGHLRYLTRRYREDNTGFGVAIDMNRAHGPLFVWWIALKPQVLITDPRTIRDTVASNIHGKQDRRAEAWLYGQRFVGSRSIFVNKGDDTWKAHRRGFNKFFTRPELRRYHECVSRVARRLVTKLELISRAGHVVVDMNHWLNLSACDVIGLVAFNWDIDSVSRDDPLFARFLDQALHGSAIATGKPLSRFLPQFKTLREDAKEAVRQLRKHCNQQIEHHLGAGSPQEPCLLDEILRLTPADREFQVDEMLAMFLAGQETVAHVMTFALAHAIRDPNILDEVEGEVGFFMADPVFDNLPALAHLDSLMKETLRLYAPVPGLRRILAGDAQLCGHRVPGGTELIHVMAVYGHHPDIWGPDHDTFNPARFTGEARKRHPQCDTRNASPAMRHPHAFLPFGIGPRVCIGREVARVEFKVFMAHLLDSFRFVPVKGEEIKAKRLTSVKPMSGYNCYIEKRETAVF